MEIYQGTTNGSTQTFSLVEILTYVEQSHIHTDKRFKTNMFPLMHIEDSEYNAAIKSIESLQNKNPADTILFKNSKMDYCSCQRMNTTLLYQATIQGFQ